MFETNSNISMQDNRSETLAHQKLTSFPQIHKKPASRGQSNIKKDLSKKNKLSLPLAKIQQLRKNPQPQTDRYPSKPKKGGIDKKLLGQVNSKQKGIFTSNNQQTAGGNQSLNQEDFEFELRIKKNREMIKEHKKDLQKSPQSKNKNQKNYSKNLSKERLEKIQIKSDRKDISPEDKFKKIRDKDSVRGSIQSIKAKPSPTNKKMSLPPKIPKKAYTDQNKALNKKMKSQNVFDNLQSFLENPQTKQKKQQKFMIGLSLLKAKRDLEEKINHINQKLQKRGQRIQDKSNRYKIEQPTASTNQWKKLSLQDKSFEYGSTTFDSEFNKIRELQGKSQSIIEDYVGFQELLVEIQFQRKLNRSKGN